MDFTAISAKLTRNPRKGFAKKVPNRTKTGRRAVGESDKNHATMVVFAWHHRAHQSPSLKCFCHVLARSLVVYLLKPNARRISV